MQAQWGLGDLLTPDQSEIANTGKEAQVGEFQKNNPKGSWDDLVGFFTGLKGK